MKVLSLYCGAGGIDEGLKQAGMKTTLSIDVWKDAIETIKLNHECETITGKVSDHISTLTKADIVVGGPPCPEFSRANLNRQFDMCEVNNFWKVVEQCKPKYYLMENVQDIKHKLIKHNYLVNSADYGVPQIRLRRFFTNLPLPSPTHAEKPQTNLFGMQQKKWVSIKEALGLEGLIEYRKNTFGEKEYRKYRDRPSSTILTDNRHFLLKDLRDKNPVWFDKHTPNDMNDPSHTIIATPGLSSMVTDGKYARPLTDEELATLQSFPKTYKFYGGKGSVRTQIGNAVPPMMITPFFKQVIQ